ncbi:MAG: metallophosphoesterase [Promethearchaeota archaeon]
MEDILIISDLHGEFEPLLNYFAHKRQTNRFKVVLSAGDFFSYQCLVCRNPKGYHRNNCKSCQISTQDWKKDPLQHIAHRLHPYPLKFPLPIYTVDGNGEEYILKSWSQLYNIVNQKIHNLRFFESFETIKIGNLRVLGFPYGITRALRSALNPDPSESEIRLFAKELGEKHGQPNIVLSHIPPFGAADISRSPGMKKLRSLGSKEIRYLLEELEPELAICGDLHYFQFAKMSRTHIFTLQRPINNHFLPDKTIKRHLGNFLELRVFDKEISIRARLQEKVRYKFLIRRFIS